jgi:hypothetical protein
MLASEDEEPDRLIAGIHRHLETPYGGSQSATLLNAVRSASIGASVAPPDASCFDFRYSPQVNHYGSTVALVVRGRSGANTHVSEITKPASPEIQVARNGTTNERGGK